MQSIEARYKEVCANFEALLEYGTSLSAELAGQNAPSDREFYATLIFAKLLGHSISLHRLLPSGLAPSCPGKTELWDLCSVGSLARVLIESFDALAYIALHNISSDERSFRIVLWYLHAEERRKEMLRLIGSTAPKVTEVEQRVTGLRKALIANPIFSTTGRKFQKDIRDENSPPFHLSRAERCRLSGISHEYYTTAYMHLSAYVHTFPFAIQDLERFNAGDPGSLRVLSVPIQYSTGFLAKAIEGMLSVFPHAITPATECAAQALGIWTRIVGVGVRMTDGIDHA